MDEQNTQTAHARRPSGRDAKRAARAARAGASVPYITRKIPYYEVLSEEGLELMEHNADTILEEIGMIFGTTPKHSKSGRLPAPMCRGSACISPGACAVRSSNRAPRASLLNMRATRHAAW